MTTTTYPSQGSLDALGSGVGEFRESPKAAAAIAEKRAQSPFRRGWERFLRNREQAALEALARTDRRLAAEIRAARDRQDWTL